jgi:hypothetical protein
MRVFREMTITLEAWSAKGFEVSQAMSLLLRSFPMDRFRGLVNSSTLLFSGCRVIENFIISNVKKLKPFSLLPWSPLPCLNDKY